MNVSYQRKLNSFQKIRDDRADEMKLLVQKMDTSSALQRASYNKQIGALESAMHSADGDINGFLLDALPFLYEHERLKQNKQPQTLITEEFQRHFGCKPTHTPHKTEERFPTKCPECGASRSFVDCAQEATYVCTSCGFVSSYGIAPGVNGLTHQERILLPSPPYTYKPLQHFIDLLNQVEARASRCIPGAIITALEQRVCQLRVDRDRITPHHVRAMLRDINQCKHYEDVHQITKRLNRTYQLITIPEQRKQILKNMFREVYPRFHRNARKVNHKRKNFLSYPYVAYKFCELCDWTEYLHVFPLLKSRDKLRVQDAILKLIFQELDWAWVDTI